MYSLFGILLLVSAAFANNCPCGWRIPGTSQLFTHGLFFDFSHWPDMDVVYNDTRAAAFNHEWMVYDLSLDSDNPKIRFNTKYDTGNVQIKNQHLVLKQAGYTAADLAAFKPVSVAAIQTKRLDMLHGTFRTVFKVEGAIGGSCPSMFWYHDDQTEIDIEIVTKGTSLVNDTINYTTHPSLDANGMPILNATRSVPLSSILKTNLSEYHEHRFDCGLDTGVRYYVDGQLVHSDQHHIPRVGGSLQMKLWADGNHWWSGTPSTSDVYMSIKSVIAYFNTTGTEDGNDAEWSQTCLKAGGPGNGTVCNAQLAARGSNTNGQTPPYHSTYPPYPPYPPYPAYPPYPQYPQYPPDPAYAQCSGANASHNSTPVLPPVPPFPPYPPMPQYPPYPPLPQYPPYPQNQPCSCTSNSTNMIRNGTVPRSQAPTTPYSHGLLSPYTTSRGHRTRPAFIGVWKAIIHYLLG